MKEKTLPPSSRGSTQILPPAASTTFCAIASPIPVPGYSSPAGARANMPKIRCACGGGMPMPLSATSKRQPAPSRTADDRHDRLDAAAPRT